MANKPLWMPLCPADYLKDTRHLSTLEHGAYLLLLMTAWNDGGRLPDDAARLARIAGLDVAQWAEVGPVVMAFFRQKGRAYEHGRVTREFAKAGRLIEQKREAGKASAKARADKANSNGRSTGVDDPLQRNANQSQSHTLSNDKGAVAPDDGKELFSDAVALLVSKGSSVGAAYSFLGKCRKDHGDPATLHVVTEAIRQQISEPKSWITKALKVAPANDAAALIQSVQRTYGGLEA